MKIFNIYHVYDKSKKFEKKFFNQVYDSSKSSIKLNCYQYELVPKIAQGILLLVTKINERTAKNRPKKKKWVENNIMLAKYFVCVRNKDIE